MHRHSTFYILLIPLFMLLVSCGPVVPHHEAWEGIQYSTLRILVQRDYADDFDGRINSDTRELLLNTGRNRAEILLLSYVRLHVSATENIIACQQVIPGIIAAGTIRYIDCGPDYCRAYIDYNVSDLLKATGNFLPLR